MGRRKINIQTIIDDRTRQTTFNKRKFGLLKKAYELSILCGCDIGIIIFSDNGKLHQYSNNSLDEILLRYTEYMDVFESKNNSDISKLIAKSKIESSDDEISGDSQNSSCFDPVKDLMLRSTPKTSQLVDLDRIVEAMEIKHGKDIFQSVLQEGQERSIEMPDAVAETMSIAQR